MDQWRYLLKVHIPGTEAAILRDALDGEAFGLRDRLGADELERQIEGFELAVDRMAGARWDDFAHDIEVLSLYLTDDVSGIEIQVGEELRGWRLIGHRGEVVRLEIEVAWDESGQVVELGSEIVAALAKRWSELPDWIKEGMRAKHGDLDPSS
jgi:hypothetical protein